MSKIVTIPTGGGNPFVVILGGVKYVYKPGETVEVPDGVALEIEEWERWHEKHSGENEPPFGAQPDLSQNDPDAADFVKGKEEVVFRPDTAEVGQTIVVKSVDENGKPTEWEAANVGEKWELIADVTFEEEAQRFEYTFDEPLKKLRVVVDTLAADTNTNFSTFTVEFPCENTLHYKASTGNIYPLGIPRTVAMTSTYDIETYYRDGVPFVDITTAINGNGNANEGDRKVLRVSRHSLKNQYDNNIMLPKIQKFSQQTYGTFAVGTRYRLFGVKA